VTVAIGERDVATFTPSSDFAETIVLPAGLLASAGGQVRVTSDQHFVPADRDGSADRRRLALRIFRIAVE
jgi:hypothetical protein